MKINWLILMRISGGAPIKATKANALPKNKNKI